MQIPSNMVLETQVFSGAYICEAMGVWGVISAAQSWVKSFAGLAVARFFVDFVGPRGNRS